MPFSHIFGEFESSSGHKSNSIPLSHVRKVRSFDIYWFCLGHSLSGEILTKLQYDHSAKFRVNPWTELRPSV